MDLKRVEELNPLKNLKLKGLSKLKNCLIPQLVDLVVTMILLSLP